MVGTFRFASTKQSNTTNAHQGRCLAHMFVMRVAEELEVWPEFPQRKRCWVSWWCSGGAVAVSSRRRGGNSSRGSTPLLSTWQQEKGQVTSSGTGSEHP